MSHHTKHAHKHSSRQHQGHPADHRDTGRSESAEHHHEEDVHRPTASVVHRDGQRTVTVTIPVDSVAGTALKAVKLPVTAAQRILPAKGGLPLYLGVGALGVAGVLEWPVAAGIGIGYAVLRKGGDLRPPPGRARA